MDESLLCVMATRCTGRSVHPPPAGRVSLSDFVHLPAHTEPCWTALRSSSRCSPRERLGYCYKPRMDRGLLAEHAAGIIAATGCPAREVQIRAPRSGMPGLKAARSNHFP